MKVLNLCCTYNRVHCLKRSVKCFIDQDYEGEQVLFIYNTGAPIEMVLPELPNNKKIILVNSGKDYKSVGEKYKDALSQAPEADVVTSWDDDDIFLPWFNRKGVIGLTKAKEQGKLAYKTLYSFYRHSGGVEKMNNVFEPAIFLDYSYIKDKGYLELNVKYHDAWLLPLIENNKIEVDKNEEPLFIYDWHPELRVFKMSGGQESPTRFSAHQMMSNSVLPSNEKLEPNKSNQYYYDLIHTANRS